MGSLLVSGLAVRFMARVFMDNIGDSLIESTVDSESHKAVIRVFLAIKSYL